MNWTVIEASNEVAVLLVPSYAILRDGFGTTPVTKLGRKHIDKSCSTFVYICFVLQSQLK